MSDDDKDLKDEIAFHLQAEPRRIERGESPEARAPMRFASSATSRWSKK